MLASERIGVEIAEQHALQGARTMRAIVQQRYGGPETLVPGRRPVPVPGPQEVLVRVRAAGLDRGTWHLMTGRPYMVRLAFGMRRPKQPTPGLDLAGTVEAVGAEVTGFAPGDEVFGIGQGSFAERSCARADKLARKPARLSFEEAAVLGISGLTALQALRDEAAVKAGERVLILGASGGVGTYAVQLAKHFGAVVTAVCSAGKMELVRSLGADRVLDYASSDVLALAGPHEVILDIGGSRALRHLRRALTAEGRLVFIGAEHGDFTAGFGRQLWARMCAPFTRQRFATFFMSRERASDLEVLAALAQAGAITPVLHRVVPFGDAAVAMHELETGKVRGKVALRIGALDDALRS